MPKSTVLPAAGDEYDAPVVVLPLLEDEEIVALRFTFIVVLPFVSVSVPV